MGSDATIPTSEFVSRRKKVLRALKDGVGIVFAGEGAPPLVGHWTPDQNFHYITGITNEPGAIVLFDPRAEDPRRRCILFLRPLNPEAEAWDGYRDPIGSRLRARYGFETVMRTGILPLVLQRIIAARRRLVCLHPFAAHTRAVSPDLALFRKIVERAVGATIDEQVRLLPTMRSVKSPAELKLMARAVRATASGFDAALRAIRPGVNEREIQRVIEDGFIRDGASGPAYNSIVGSGVNGTVLHYNANDGTAKDGELVVIDAGAQFGGYAADITRTFPVSGRFTKEHKELYTLVLRAQKASIAAVQPGAKMVDVNEATRRIFEKAGLADAYLHGIGHHLGLEVHDADPAGELRPGNVVTIEPGLYFKDRAIGIRIEDDILVTRDGRRNLSSRIPKSIADIESAMRTRR